ncbi:MAG: glycosyltransferase family 2 protein [Pseudomonadota bacterium]
MSLPKIASLWIGGSLSFLEQVCLKSFVDHGHHTVLYVYGRVGGVPTGVDVQDANIIYPNQNFIRHKRSGSPAIHADAFRYRMIEVEDVIWVDADMLCMRPWDFSSPYVFGWEKSERLVCNAVLGLPRGSETLAKLNTLCSDEYPIPPWAAPEERTRLEEAKAAGDPVHVSELSWGVWGPAALTHFLFETGEMSHVLPQQAFYPIPFKDRRDLLDPKVDIAAQLGSGCYGVHLWNRRLRRRIVTHENGVPHPESFLGRALERHQVDPGAAPIPDEPPGKAAASAPPVPAFQSQIAVATPPAARASLPVDPNPQSTSAAHLSAVQERHTSRTLGWLPVPDQTPPSERILVVTSMKNEAPFILEWIAYNRSIGVTDFLVYTNDCSDNTTAILDRLAQLGHVVRVDNPWRSGSGEKPQHVALKDAVRQPLFRRADWVLTIDVDEFVNIHVGNGTFSDFFDAAGQPNVASFTWKFFGNGGIDAYEDRPIAEQFLRCAPEVIPKPRLGWGFKSMFHKSSGYRAIGVHRPLKPLQNKLSDVRWVNGSGKVMPTSTLTRGWRSTTHSLGYELATLNHYVLRSAESYLVKRDRGRINHTDQDQGLYYWTRRNYASECDNRILRRLPRMEAERAQLMSDPDLARLHEEAVAWHRAKIDRLKSDPDYLALFQELIKPDRPDAIFVRKEEAREVVVSEKPRIGPLDDIPDVQRPALAKSVTRHPRFESVGKTAAEVGGFLWQGAQNAAVFIPRGRSLIVSFDAESDVKTEQQRLPAWFETAHTDLGASVLGVMAVTRNWFRDPFVTEVFDALRDQAFFDTFDDVLFLGHSMGGYGAAAFSRAAGAKARVLAIAPQATLNRADVPGDERWGWTARLDWTGSYADAASPVEAKQTRYLIYDPTDELDELHASRFRSEGTTLLAAPFMGHAPQKDMATGIPDIVGLALSGELTTSAFHRLRRARWSEPRYQDRVIRRALDRGHLGLAKSAARRALQIGISRKIKSLLAEIEDGGSASEEA